MFNFDLQSREHARKVHQILHTAHWVAYCEMGKIPNGSASRIFAEEAERATASALKSVTEEAKAKFGNNKAHPDCDYCLTVSVFGGPSHEASPRCRSGRHDHCTCDTCF